MGQDPGPAGDDTREAEFMSHTGPKRTPGLEIESISEGQNLGELTAVGKGSLRAGRPALLKRTPRRTSWSAGLLPRIVTPGILRAPSPNEG